MVLDVLLSMLQEYSMSAETIYQNLLSLSG